MSRQTLSFSRLARAHAARIVAVATVALVGACGSSPTDSDTPSDRSPRLAYVRRGRLHLVDADGSRDSAITPDTRTVDWHAWSRDGRVAYLTPDGAVRVLNPATGDERIVAALGRGVFVTLGWLPDASRIYYVEADRMKLVSPEGGVPQEFPVRVDGYGTPAWSPDGKRVAIRIPNAQLMRELWVYNADGTGGRRVVPNVGADHPAWSPDGQSLAFSVNAAIWVASADGGNVRVVIPGTCPCATVDIYDHPRWSPDGSMIAGIKGVTEMFVVRADGAGLKLLATNPRIAPFPEWSPNGGRIAFMAGGYTSQNLHTMRPDGSDEVAVTDLGQVDLPRWVR